MKRKDRYSKGAVIGIIIILVILVMGANSAYTVPLTGGGTTVNWQAIPPYNLLWPLWSPVLSPADPVTGLATPLLPFLDNSTLLPVQPVLFWDPLRDYPFFLYNIPDIFGGGRTYFDVFYGLNPWPPSYLIDPATGLPSPITLPTGYATLSPTAILPGFVFTGNLLYSEQYGVPVTSLLTAGDIWGALPLSGLLPL